jgi:Rrf2 family protein
MKKNSIINFSNATMLAIHALALIIINDKIYLTTKEIANQLGASENHLAKIMQILVKNKLVNSIKGPSGGFYPNEDSEKITLKKVIEIIEGPIDKSFCPFFKNCVSTSCILGKEIEEYNKKIIKILEQTTIKDLAKNMKLKI